MLMVGWSVSYLPTRLVKVAWLAWLHVGFLSVAEQRATRLSCCHLVVLACRTSDCLGRLAAAQREACGCW